MRAHWGVAGIMGAVVALGSCGDDQNGTQEASIPKCIPGEVRSCPCASGMVGIQSCQSDGTFTPCDCASGAGGADGGAGGAGGTVGTGGIGGMAGLAGAAGDGGAPPSLEPIWSKAFGPGAQLWTLDADSAGNVMIVGELREPVDFGNGPVGGNLNSNPEIFVASFDPSGNRRFAYSLEASRFYRASTAGFSARMDASGNVVVTGTALRKVGASTIRFPCGSQPSTGDPLNFVARVDATGNCVWVKTFGQSYLPLGSSTVVATVDDHGSTYVTGRDLSVSSEPFVAKIDANGYEVWKTPGTFGHVIEIDAAGALYIAAIEDDPVGWPKLCVEKLDPSGVSLWADCYGSPRDALYYDASISGLSVNSQGAFALADHFEATLDFGGGSVGTAGTPSIFVAALDTTGGHLFSNSLPEAKSDSGGYNPAPVHPAVADNGDVALVGGFWRTINFGSGPLTAIGTSDEDTDAFIAVYDSLGHLAISKQYGGPGLDWVEAAHYDSSGALLVAGRFSQEIDLGDRVHQVSGGSDWIFVARLSP